MRGNEEGKGREGHTGRDRREERGGKGERHRKKYI